MKLKYNGITNIFGAQRPSVKLGTTYSSTLGESVKNYWVPNEHRKNDMYDLFMFDFKIRAGSLALFVTILFFQWILSGDVSPDFIYLTEKEEYELMIEIILDNSEFFDYLESIDWDEFMVKHKLREAKETNDLFIQISKIWCGSLSIATINLRFRSCTVSCI